MTHKISVKKHLLLSTAFALGCAMLGISPALAADINVTTDPDNAAKTAANDGDRLVVNAGGNLVVTGAAAFESSNFDEVSVLVNTGNVAKGVSSNSIVLDFEDASTSIGSINVTSGTVTSSSGASSVLINTMTDTYTINVGTGGRITNTGTGGEILAMLAVNGDQTVTINNDGLIQGTNDAGTIGVRMYDADGGSSWTINNTGSIITGNNSIAVGTESGGGSTNKLVFTNSGASSVVTGNVDVAAGANDTASITNQGTVTGYIKGTAGKLTLANSNSITGAVSTTTGYLNITGNSGTIGGNVSTGSGKLDYTSSGAGVVNQISTTSGAATLILNNTSKVTGLVALGSSGSSSATLNDTSRIGGNVTLGNAGQSFTFNGGTLAGTISGTGNVAVNANTTLENFIDITGNMTIAANKSLNVGTNNFKANTTLGSGSTLDLSNGAHTVTGTLAGSGGSIFSLGTATQTVSSTFTTAANDALNLTINGTANTNSGRIAAATTAVNAGTKLNITLSTSGFIENGTQYVIVNGNAGTAAALTSDATQINVNGSNTNKTQFLRFTTSSVDAGHDLALNVERVSYSTAVPNTRNSANAGVALDSLGAGATGTLSTFISALDGYTTTGQVETALASATPEVDNSATQGVYLNSAQTFDLISNRLDDVRYGRSGVSAGDPAVTRNVWMQGFGASAHQGLRDQVTGYTADSYGMAVGADKAMDDRMRLGLSLNYANTNVNSHGGVKGTDIDTYQLNLYGTRDYGAYFAEGLAGFAWNRYDSTRYIPAASAKANANFDGQTYMARVSAGYHQLWRGFDITPKATLTYAHVHMEDYTETGAGALNLSVKNDDVNVLEPRVGVEAGYAVHSGQTTLRPNAHISYGYDVIGDEQSTNLRFAGTAPSFRNRGSDIAQSSVAMGAGLELISVQNLTVSANYDYEMREDYHSQSGMLRAKYLF